MNRITAIFATVLLVSLAASTAVVHRVDQLRAGAPSQDVLYVGSPKALKRLSLGYSGLLADVYWTRTVQYFGGKHYLKATRYDLLAPLLDITTELDPHLMVAYQFGSIFLSQQPPEGSGQPEQAVALVERGIRENPAEWRLYYNLGWIEFDRKDFAAASRAFARAAKVAGAPPSMTALAATMAQHAGERQTARFLWVQIYNTTTDTTIRANALKRLQALQVDEQVANLEAALRAYQRATGHYPSAWSQLAAIGWRGSINDPSGHPYVLKPEGRVEVQDAGAFPFITRGLPPGVASPGLAPGGQTATQPAGESNSN